jgi:hypothetical protein
MREVSPGDIVFSFVDTRIVAIGIAQSYCWESPKPQEFGTTGANWENIGWKVRVTFNELLHRVRPKDHMTVLLDLMPADMARSRCPVTLRRLSMQVFVGLASPLLHG